MPSPRGARRSAPRHRPRTLFDICGEVELAILKTRAGSFFPSLSEPCRWLDWTFGAVITVAVPGALTRKVADLVRALGVDSGVSKSTVSRMCWAEAQMGTFRTAGSTTRCLP